MLSAQQLQIDGRRDDLLPPTSLEARRGELLLVSGDGQDQRTALALALSGRMKTSKGLLSWDNSAKTKKAPGCERPD